MRVVRSRENDVGTRMVWPRPAPSHRSTELIVTKFLLILLLALCTSSWTVPASAGENLWTWVDGFFPGGSCHQPSLTSTKDCFTAWIAVVGSNAHCGVTGSIDMGPTSTGPTSWWARIMVTSAGSGFDCSGPNDGYRMEVAFIEQCPPGMQFDTKYGCGPPQRADANGCLSKANPCDVLTGNKRQVEVDYGGGAGGLGFQRTYNSSSYRALLPDPYGKPLGEQWFGQYLQHLLAPGGLNSSLLYAIRPGGDVAVFSATNPGSTTVTYSGDGEIKDRLMPVLDGSGAFIGWRYISANDDQELYDTSGRLLSIRTRGGVTQTLVYGTNGRVASVTDDFDHELTFQWDTASPPRLSSVTLPDTGQIVFTYTGNNLTQVTYPDTKTRQYLYELSGTGQQNLLTGLTDEASTRYATWGYGTGNVVTSSAHAGGVDSYSLTYNTNGTRVVVDPVGTSRTYATQVIAGQRRYTGSSLKCHGCGEYASATFDAYGNFASKTNFAGIETRYTHDTARTLETSRTEAYGTARARTITTAWHSTFRLPTQIDEPGKRTTFTHDSNGNILTKTVLDTSTSESRTWTYTYNSFGQVLTANGPRTDVSDVTTYTYYSCTTGYQCGQLHTVTDALSHITTYNTYNAHGQPLTITDTNGVVTTLTYDARQRLTSRAVGSEQTTFTYWPTGLLKKATLPDSSFLEYTYDAAHRLTQIEDSEGNNIVYTLDAMGNRTAEQIYDPSDALTQTRTRVFNTLNQLWKEIGAAGTSGVTTSFSYDDNGNQTDINAPLSRNTTQEYDELNRLTQVTDPLSGEIEYGYNALDQLISVNRPEKQIHELHLQRTRRSHAAGEPGHGHDDQYL